MRMSGILRKRLAVWATILSERDGFIHCQSACKSAVAIHDDDFWLHGVL